MTDTHVVRPRTDPRNRPADHIAAKRPPHILWAYWMAVVGTVAAIASNVLELVKEFRDGGGLAGTSDLIITITFIALFVYFADMMRRGREWGRVILALFAFLGLVFNTLGLLHLGGRPISGTLQVTLAVLGNVASLVGLAAMYAPSANAWFRVVRDGARTISQRTRKAMLAGHVVISVGWIGMILAMDSMAAAAAITDAPDTQRAVFEMMLLLDELYLGLMSFFALLTGLLGAVGTMWHLLRRRWVATKFYLTLAIMCLGFGYNHPLISKGNHLVHTGAPVSTVRDSAAIPLVVGATIPVTLLVFMTLVSLYKPWGLTRYGRRKQAESRVPAPTGS